MLNHQLDLLTPRNIEDSYSTQRNVDGKSYRVDIIDTAGQEEYRDMLGSLFGTGMSIDAYVMVYDITSTISLENLQFFDEMIEKNLDIRPKDAPVPVKIVAGNKCDLSEHRAISSSEGLQWAKDHGCKFMETSAKAMVNIEETFQIVIRQIAQNRKEALEREESQARLTHSASRPRLRTALSAANIRASNKEKVTAAGAGPGASPSGENNGAKKRGCCIVM